MKDLGVTQLFFISELSEGAVGQGFPKEKAEAGGNCMIIEGAGLLDEGEESL